MSVKQRVKLNAPKPTKKKMTDTEILAALRECLYALLLSSFMIRVLQSVHSLIFQQKDL